MATSPPGPYATGMFDWKPLNAEVLSEFRTNGGKVARFGDLPVVILHTIGAKSGTVREVPLIVVFDEDEMLLYGTKAGSPTHPDWYFNLRAHPRIAVEFGTERFTADVIQMPEDEAAKKVRAQAESTPQFSEYVASAAPRVIPVFSIRRL
jgi:deazaflavin-dependent oxidoreductase (nitroreductase family)